MKTRLLLCADRPLELYRREVVEQAECARGSISSTAGFSAEVKRQKAGPATQ
jgi:hypothetical protein